MEIVCKQKIDMCIIKKYSASYFASKFGTKMSLF